MQPFESDSLLIFLLFGKSRQQAKPQYKCTELLTTERVDLRKIISLRAIPDLLGIATLRYGLHCCVYVLHQGQAAVQSRVAVALQEVAGLGAFWIGELLGQAARFTGLQVEIKALVLGQPPKRGLGKCQIDVSEIYLNLLLSGWANIDF